MDISSKASIVVSAKLTVAEVIAAVRDVPGVSAAILDVAQAEVVKDASGLTFVSRDLVLNDDGTAIAGLVYEKAEAAPAAAPVVDASAGTEAPAILPLTLQPVAVDASAA